MSPRKMALGSFNNNVAHSNRNSGLMLDQFQNMDQTIQFTANPAYNPQTVRFFFSYIDLIILFFTGTLQSNWYPN